MRKGGLYRLPAVCCVLGIMAPECVSTRYPSVIQRITSTSSPVFSQTPGSTWAFENLKPDESIILVEGKTIPFSVDLKFSGDAQYAITFSSDKKELHPAYIRSIPGPGDIVTSETITWFEHVAGESETVTVALYKIEESESSKTQVKTLVKQIKRKYSVICNKSDRDIVLLVKRIFGICKCGSSKTQQKK